MRTRIVALLAGVLLVAVLVINDVLRPPADSPGGWLFQNASAGLVKGCAVFAAAYYLAWVAFVTYQHFWGEPRWRAAAAEDVKHLRAPAVVTPLRAQRPAPTQPLPVPPDEAPTVVNE